MGIEWIQENSLLFAIIVVWDLVWRGIGLWHAARNKAKVWYVFILVVNSAGILPILYLLLGKDRKGKAIV